ncbi:cytosolic phospholipase A2 delta isoform X2 [Xenopus tropicalis]|uniref:Phospholipase A2 n=1 Tax=Xenopus tropicalis TaxID=8364 RepID=F6V411_XENTR|nr:cytosolic phospholipase A2 delta isoform X2 [Xenopus tropicalis]
MASSNSTGPYQEESPLSLLFVKVIRARNIPWADWMSNADCYVSLWLPSSTNKLLKTATAADTSNPVWNETFQFKISANIKNVLEVTLYDEDTVSKNDLLYKMLFDVSKITPGETMKHSFLLNPPGKETLDVEFSMKKMPAHPETIKTNGVLVAREVCCLDVSVDKQKIPENLQGEELLLQVENSCEKLYKMGLNPTAGPNHTETCSFHSIKRYDSQLSAHLQGANPEDVESQVNVPLNSLTEGKEETVRLHAKPDSHLEMKVKAQNCKEKFDVRMGFDLCDDEKDFLRKRKKVAAAALKSALKLDRDLEEDEVPIIAVTTTGGGARAMTALYGTLSGLKKLNLLDCVFYITGASGSTWGISNLYEDAEWSQKDLDVPIENARRNVCKDKKSSFSLEKILKYREEMKKRAEMGYKTSFTDIWGLVIESMFHNGDGKTTLSNQRKAVERGQNPLPLCLAMNVKHIENTTLDFKEWCEFSPYEVGLLKYGAYIRSEDFASSFYMGRLIKKLPESRICFLQGLWSNIFSINLMDAWFAAVSSDNFWHRFTRDNIQDLDGEEALRRKSASPSLGTLLIQPAGYIGSTIRDILTSRPIDGEHHNFLKGLQIHKDFHSHKSFCCFKDTELDKFPNKLTPYSDDLCLVDSAYYINASFPPLLREERKVDVILSFDYGLAERFKSVEQTHEYCCNQKIAFPKVNLTDNDREKPKECHVFTKSEDLEAPILLHFPLVNDTFRTHKAPGVKRSPEEMEGGAVEIEGRSPYSLLKLTYSKENFDKLLNLTEYNVMNNEEAILQALRDAIAQKQKSRGNSGTNTNP